MLCASPSFVTFVCEKFHRWKSTERVLIFPAACAAARFRCFFCTRACHHCKVMQKRSLTIDNNHARTKKPRWTKNIYKWFSILFNRLNIFDIKMAGQPSVFMYFQGVKCSLNHSFKSSFIPSIFFLIGDGKFHLNLNKNTIFMRNPCAHLKHHSTLSKNKRNFHSLTFTSALFASQTAFLQHWRQVGWNGGFWQFKN